MRKRKTHTHAHSDTGTDLELRFPGEWARRAPDRTHARAWWCHPPPSQLGRWRRPASSSPWTKPMASASASPLLHWRNSGNSPFQSQNRTHRGKIEATITQIENSQIIQQRNCTIILDVYAFLRPCVYVSGIIIVYICRCVERERENALVICCRERKWRRCLIVGFI